MASPQAGRLACGVLGMAALSACGAGWHRPSNKESGDLAPRQQVQVWSHGQAVQWHAVQITADSVTGIPYFKPITCDSCRRTIPRSAVDSIKLGNPVAGFWKTVAIVVGAPFLLLIPFCWHGCPSEL